MATYYPASKVEDICNGCYASESACSKPLNGSSQNSTYCGTCNVDCNTSQTFCGLGVQVISNHADVGTFGGFGATTDALIFEKWTASKWNELQQLYEKANSLGITSSQGGGFSFTRAVSDRCNNTHPANSLITADKYNQFSTAAAAFSSTIPTVTGVTKDNPGTPIRLEHSTALETGFANAKFKTSVCDICNVGTQHNCGYNCQCNYNCSYNCYYNCSYNCSHNCSHNCGTNVTDDNGAK